MSGFSADDPLPALQAEVDQQSAMAPLLARWAKGLFDGFKGEGFSDAQALYMTAVQMKDTPGTAPR